MRSAKIFSVRLQAAREKKGWSQADLATRAGLQPSAVSHFEKGRRIPSAANLERLADALAVSADYLLGRVDTPSPVGPTVTQLLSDFAQMAGSDQENLMRFASVLAQKSR